MLNFLNITTFPICLLSLFFWLCIIELSMIIKTQLTKLIKSFNLPGPKALPLVLFDQRFVPFGKHVLIVSSWNYYSEIYEARPKIV